MNFKNDPGTATEIVLAHLRQEWPAARTLLERLVRLNSHTCNSEGIEANVRLLIEEFAPMGFVPRRIPPSNPEHSPHLILDNQAPGPVVVMVSHLDTVYTPEEQAEGFHKFETPEGFLTGPGTNDIKGGTVMMWMLMRAWAATLLPGLPSVRWILAWNASEEKLTSCFSKSLTGILPPSTVACLVFEADNRKASGHEILASRKGMARWKIYVRGRGAHSGNSHAEGMNAIVRLAEIVAQMKTLTDYDKGLTVNVGTIEGGVSTNRVPESASAAFEVRYVNLADYERVRSRLLEWNDAGCFDGPLDCRRCEVVMESQIEIQSWSGGAETELLQEIWRKAAQSCGQELTVGTRGGLGDANFLGSQFPTLDGLGPRGGNAHTVERTADGFSITEYVEPESFFTKGLINFFALRSLVSDTTHRELSPPAENIPHP